MKALILIPVLAGTLAGQSAPEAILAAARSRAAAVAKARAAWIAAGNPSLEFKADLSKDLAGVNARLAKETAAEARRALLVARLMYRRLARELPSAQELAETYQEVPATEPAWSLDGNLLPALEGWDPKGAGPYLDRARAAHPDPELRRSLLFGHFTDMIDMGTESDWRPSFAALQKDFPDSPEAAKARERLHSETLTAVGAPAPALDVASLDDPATRLTIATFKGSYVLVDFWASWCPDCVRDLPYVHRAHARFKDQGLKILSLSLDRKVEHIARWRAHPGNAMPWAHAYLEGGWKSPVVEAWGVRSIPKPVLVGPDGRIAASGGALRGDQLEKTLGKLLAP